MWTEQFRALARYNRWMNRRLYDTAKQLSDGDRKRDLGAYFGSLEGTLNHILLTDRLWMARLTGDEGSFASRDRFGELIPFEGQAQILYPVFAELEQNRDRLDRQIEFWVDRLTVDEFETTLDYFNTTGTRRSHPLWQILTQFFNHQTHHRGQVTTLLFQLGKDPGPTDFLAFVRGEDWQRGSP